MKIISTIILFVCTTLIAQSEVIKIQKSTATKFGEKNIIEYQVHSVDGSESKFTREFDYDVPYPKVILLSNGNLIFINSLEASIELTNKNGNSIKKIFISEKKIEYERSIFSAIDNDLLVVSLNESTEYFFQNFIIDSELNILAKSDRFSGLINGIAFIRDHNIIFQSIIRYADTTISKTIEITDMNFQNILTATGEFDKYYTHPEAPLILLYNDNHVSCFDLTSSNFLCSIKSTEIILAAKLIDDNIIILESDNPNFINNEWVYPSCKINKFSADGDLISSNKIYAENFSEFEWMDNNRIKINDLIFKLE
jgi:hypothetical protein